MTMTRRTLIASAAAILMMASPAIAVTQTAFDDAVFDAAREAGGPILVHVTAPWCGTCKAQKPIVSDIMSRADFSAFKVFEVDFDTQEDARKELRVPQQSTMIVFKDGREIGRSVGETDPAAIEELFRKAL